MLAIVADSYPIGNSRRGLSAVQASIRFYNSSPMDSMMTQTLNS